MTAILSDKIVTAKKHYQCDASYVWGQSGFSADDCETKDQAMMVGAAEADKWKILPGQAYRKVVMKQDGELVTYRARPGMDAVCRELGLFGED